MSKSLLGDGLILSFAGDTTTALSSSIAFFPAGSMEIFPLMITADSTGASAASSYPFVAPSLRTA
ncbi:MAG: hypothetical protein V1734_00565 [Nanoarchaeota archaeon]